MTNSIKPLVMTQWSDGMQRPAHSGIYEMKPSVSSSFPWFAHWDGEAWSYPFMQWDSAEDVARIERDPVQQRCFRGVAGE